MNGTPLIQMEHISKSFFGVTVFHDFSLDFRKGEVHCICGENGAGKSTLIKILSGMYESDGGTIYYKGKEKKIEKPSDSLGMGIQTIYQEHMLFPSLTVYENLFCGQEYGGKVLVDKKKMIEKTREMIAYLRADFSPFDIMENLSEGNQKIVEIARALVRDAQIIIMDEPTASFTMTEIGHILSIVKQLRDSGICIIYISHRLNEVFQIADRVTVIRDGVKINTYDIGNLTEAMLINDMVGRDVSSFYAREPVPIGDIKLEVENVTGNGVFDINFHVRQGEILGFAGMIGAGKTEVAELVFGAKPKRCGTVKIDGQSVDITSPEDAIGHKICYITESRQHNGLFLDHTIKANINIIQYRQREGFVVSDKDDRALALEYIKTLRIVTPSVDKLVKELSGGNQQKVVLSKWFATLGDIFIFDEPTRGIDVGAREEIYKLMIGLVREKKSILLISSDMPELISMSDRICVMCERHIVATLEKNEITEQTILKYSIGGTDHAN
ncbi:MAG: sugar ABC transporter ATP-binding protein [Christensenellales bacterium]